MRHFVDERGNDSMNIARAGLVLLSCLCASGLWADDGTSNRVLDKRFILYGGAQFYNAEGTLRSVERFQPDRGVELSDLGLEDNTTSPVIGATLRIGQRWRLRLDYFRYSDDARRRVLTAFPFDGRFVPAGALVDSDLTMDVYAANLAYDFIQSERARFGLGLGVHAADLDMSVGIRARVPGSRLAFGGGDEALLAPVPNLYANGAYAFTDNLLLRYGAAWMDLTYDDYDGELLSAQAFLEYWPFRNAGIGAGYRHVSIDVRHSSGTKREEYDLTLPGPMVYLTLGF
jgi:hypothetical protein